MSRKQRETSAVSTGYKPFQDLDLLFEEHEREGRMTEFEADVERRRQAEQARLDEAATLRARRKARKAERRCQPDGSTL